MSIGVGSEENMGEAPGLAVPSWLLWPLVLKVPVMAAWDCDAEDEGRLVKRGYRRRWGEIRAA